MHKILALLFFLGFSFSLLAQNKTNEAGRKVGKWVITGEISSKPGYAPTAKVEEGEYANGRKVGVWVGYYPSGKQKNQITFENGRPKGPYTTYYENGQIEEQGTWSLNKNQGSFKRYYENGQVQQDFKFDATGKRNGPQKYYHENGQLMIEGNWNGGKEDGEVKEYFENGEIKSVRVFNGGQMDASKSTFKKPSTPAVAPKADPPVVETPDAKAKTPAAVNTSQSTANIGKFDGNGQHTLYNRNRQIQQKGLFKNGKLYTGKYYKYNRDGLLESIELYQNGKFVGNGVIDKSMQ